MKVKGFFIQRSPRRIEVIQERQ